MAKEKAQQDGILLDAHIGHAVMDYIQTHSLAIGSSIEAGSLVWRANADDQLGAFVVDLVTRHMKGSCNCKVPW